MVAARSNTNTTNTNTNNNSFSNDSNISVTTNSVCLVCDTVSSLEDLTHEFTTPCT